MKLDKIILTSFALLAAGCGDNPIVLQPGPVVDVGAQQSQLVQTADGRVFIRPAAPAVAPSRVSSQELARLDGLTKNITAYRNMFYVPVNEVSSGGVQDFMPGLYAINSANLKYGLFAQSSDPGRTHSRNDQTRATIRSAFLVQNEQVYADRSDNGTMDMFTFLSPGNQGFDFHIFVDADTKSRGPFQVYTKDNSGLRSIDSVRFQEIGGKGLFYDRVNVGGLDGNFSVFFSNIDQSNIDRAYNNSSIDSGKFLAGVTRF